MVLEGEEDCYYNNKSNINLQVHVRRDEIYTQACLFVCCFFLLVKKKLFSINF